MGYRCYAQKGNLEENVMLGILWCQVIRRRELHSAEEWDKVVPRLGQWCRQCSKALAPGPMGMETPARAAAFSCGKR